MRRITVSCLILALILLGFTGLAASQNVSIQLIPITYPIVLPDSGGTFDYLLFVTNQGGSPITADVWCMVTLPSGTSWGPVVGPATRTLAAGQTLGYYRTQSIPARAPYGVYAYTAKVGIYPDSIWSNDSFEFEKQAPSGGTELWVARYNGTANDNDRAYSLAVDSGGNVYVTGKSDSETSYDYATVKYDASGNQLWMALYNGPGNSQDIAWSSAWDGNTNVYVTGESHGSGTGADYATIKYDASGNQLWVARYNGPGNDDDAATSLALDSDGNIYVTGYSYGSGTDDDYATIKYDAAGNQLWVSRYNGPGNIDDQANCIAVDGGGNVYVTGYSYGGVTSDDYATVKYNALGNQLWVARYNGPGGSDEARSLAVDGGGNVYVTGRSHGSGVPDDYATIKYDALGNQLWVARYDGLENGDDWANSLALDGGRNIYVTGLSYSSGTYFDYATVKYDALGNQIWVAIYDGPGNGIDEALSLAVDGDGNVYVTGNSDAQTGTGANFDYATVKYDTSGNQIWVARYNGLGNDYDEAASLAVDGGGNVYVTGYSFGSGTNYDYATIKYSGGNVDNWMPVEATVLGQSAWGGPQEYRLEQNYPNPFNASTAISYELRAASFVSLRVYDTAGRLVETLVDGWRSAGTHELTFHAADLPSGMYVYRIQAGDWTQSGKMVLLK